MRPPHLITPEELRFWMRKNEIFRIAWEEAKPYIVLRDKRGSKAWLFAWGWLACAYYYRFFMRDQLSKLKLELQREADASKQMVDEWDKKSGLGFFTLGGK